MNRLFLVTTIVLGFAASAHAGSGHIVQGLFCNTERQIDEALGHIRLNIPPQAAVALTNDAAVVCTYADRIRYLVVNPTIREMYSSTSLVKYEGTLIGVLVGDNVRPVEPPVRIFFVVPERLVGTVAAGGA